MTKAARPVELPEITAQWIAFLAAYSAFYKALLGAGSAQLQQGVTLSKAVQTSLKIHATGKWATMMPKTNCTKTVFVGFAERSVITSV